MPRAIAICSAVQLFSSRKRRTRAQKRVIESWLLVFPFRHGAEIKGHSVHRIETYGKRILDADSSCRSGQSVQSNRRMRTLSELRNEVGLLLNGGYKSRLCLQVATHFGQRMANQAVDEPPTLQVLRPRARLTPDNSGRPFRPSDGALHMQFQPERAVLDPDALLSSPRNRQRCSRSSR